MALNAVACPEMVDIAVLEHPMNRIAAVLVPAAGEESLLTGIV